MLGRDLWNAESVWITPRSFVDGVRSGGNVAGIPLRGAYEIYGA